MPRDPRPWFRKDHDAWFVTINGRRFNLSTDRNATHDRFHELMLTGGEGDTGNDPVTVFQLFDDFLEWTKAQCAPRTYEWHRDFLDAFSSFLVVDRSALRLKPIDLIRWTAKHPKWSPTYQRACIRSVQRAFDQQLASIPMRASPWAESSFLTQTKYQLARFRQVLGTLIAEMSL
jgi:hypothetical protein